MRERERVVGRVNVEDSQELLRYYEELERLDAGALWNVANEIEPWEPRSTSAGKHNERWTPSPRSEQ